MILLCAAWAPAQSVSFGFKAGLPLTELLTAAAPGYGAGSSRYTFGPALEIGLPHRLAFEASLLYKHLEYTFPQGPPGAASGGFSAGAAAARWEVPLLLKYGFNGRLVRPFVGVGLSFNRVTGAKSVVANNATLVELRHRGAKGVVAAAGVEARMGGLRLAPEVRITRWADRNFGVSDARLHSNLTQVELLVGFFF